MKSVFLFLAIVAWRAEANEAIPDGTYEGEGRHAYRDDTDFAYEVKLVVTGNRFAFVYYWGDGKTSYTAELKYTSKYYFDVLIGGKKVGTGYTEAGMMHIDYTEGDHEETFFYEDKIIKRIGSMKRGAIIYTETLITK